MENGIGGYLIVVQITLRCAMSWTQVYMNGLPQSILPCDDDIESSLAAAYNFTDPTLGWAGPGTTSIQRDELGQCRGFAFLAFYHVEGATLTVDRINNNNSTLRAEISKPKAKKGNKAANADAPDLRLRRQRGAPMRKHPVIVSSNGKKTNLGNKTK